MEEEGANSPAWRKTTFGVQDFRFHDWRVGGAAVKGIHDRHPCGEFSASPEGVHSDVEHGPDSL